MIYPILYSFRRCPYAMRARLALWTSGVQCELREILLKDKPTEMLELSPKGTVPVLVLADGLVLDESLDIMDWALQGQDAVLAFENGVVKSLIEQNDGIFKSHIDGYKYAGRYKKCDSQAHFVQAQDFLGQLEACLSRSVYVCGDDKTAADIAIFPFVRQFAGVDPKAFQGLPFPHVQKWLDNALNHASFQKIMQKYPLWKPGNPAVFLM